MEFDSPVRHGPFVSPPSSKPSLRPVLTTDCSDIITGIMRLVVSVIGPANIIEQGLIWGVLEPSVAILVACFPMYRPLAEKWGWMGFINSTVKSWGKTGKHGRTGDQYAKMDDDQIELVTDPHSAKSKSRASAYRPGNSSASSGAANLLESHKGPIMTADQIGVKKDITVIEE